MIPVALTTNHACRPPPSGLHSPCHASLFILSAPSYATLLSSPLSPLRPPHPSATFATKFSHLQIKCWSFFVVLLLRNIIFPPLSHAHPSLLSFPFICSSSPLLFFFPPLLPYLLPCLKILLSQVPSPCHPFCCSSRRAVLQTSLAHCCHFSLNLLRLTHCPTRSHSPAILFPLWPCPPLCLLLLSSPLCLISLSPALPPVSPCVLVTLSKWPREDALGGETNTSGM